MSQEILYLKYLMRVKINGMQNFLLKGTAKDRKKGETILQLRGFIQKPKINQKFQKNLNIFFLPMFGRSQQLKYKEAETLAYNQSKRLGSLKFVGMSDISFRPEYILVCGHRPKNKELLELLLLFLFLLSFTIWFISSSKGI